MQEPSKFCLIDDVPILLETFDKLNHVLSATIRALVSPASMSIVVDH